MLTTKRRKLSITATFAVFAMTLAACGGGDSNEGGSGWDSDGETESQEVSGTTGAMDDYDIGTTFAATEPITFSLLYRDHPNYPLKEDWLILEELENNQNVTFDIVSAPLSDWDQRKGLLIGAGDAPDTSSLTYPGQEVQFVAGGAILPVSDYLEYLQNFTDKVEKWDLGETVDNLRQEDGKFYLLPGLRESIRPQYTYAVRKDIWDELDLTLEPESYDEFRDQLQTVKDASTDAWPIYDRWSASGPLEATLNMAAPSFGTGAGWGFGEGVYWDDDAGEYVYTGAMDEYRDMLAYYASLVEDGLMDPESLTQDDDQAEQKFGAGDSIVMAANDQEILRYRSTFEEQGNDDAEVALLRLPAGPAGDMYPAGSRLQSGLMLSSGVEDSDNFLALLQFIDWLYYSDEGLEFAKWGVEGVTYTKDDDGTRHLADDIDINDLNPGASESLNVDYGFHNGVWMLEHGSTEELDRSMLRDEVIDFVETMSTKEELPLPPPWPLEELEREQVSLWQTALKDHVWQNTARFILGQRSLDEWDDYVSELEGMNMNSYLDVVNEAQQRFAESQAE